MDIFQVLTLIISVLALIISSITGYFQYKARQDLINENLEIKLKMTLDGSVMTPTELRMVSGVEEKNRLKPAILITNIGNCNLRILKAGYQGLDLPNYAYTAKPNKTKLLRPGEQVIFTKFSDPNLIKIFNQLVDDITLKNFDESVGTVFALTTKGNYFASEAIIQVAK